MSLSHSSRNLLNIMFFFLPEETITSGLLKVINVSWQLQEYKSQLMKEGAAGKKCQRPETRSHNYFHNTNLPNADAVEFPLILATFRPVKVLKL